MPLVGQSSPVRRRAAEGYPPGRPQRWAVERRPPLVEAAPTPHLGYALSPPVQTPPHRWSVASHHGPWWRCLQDCRHRRGAERQRVTHLAGRSDSWLSGVLLWQKRRQRLVAAVSCCLQSGRHLTGGRSRCVVATWRRRLRDCRHCRGAGRQRVTRLVGPGSGRLGGVLLLWAPLPQSQLACLHS